MGPNSLKFQLYPIWMSLAQQMKYCCRPHVLHFTSTLNTSISTPSIQTEWSEVLYVNFNPLLFHFTHLKFTSLHSSFIQTGPKVFRVVFNRKSSVSECFEEGWQCFVGCLRIRQRRSNVRSCWVFFLMCLFARIQRILTFESHPYQGGSQ